MTNVVVNSATPPEHHRFHFLDALRGLAAILVIMRHSPPVYAQSFVTENSFLAVDFFFCLSGFVIAFSYEQRLSTYLTFKNFFVARLIRLYPIAAIGTVVGAVELALQLHLHAPVGTFISRIVLETALGLLVLPSARYVLFPLDRVMWTLFFELIANLLYAVLVRRRLATTGFLVILATLAAIALTGERLHLGTLDRGYTFDSAYVGFSRVSLSFLLGVLTFRLYRHQARARLLVGPSILAATAITFVFVLALCGPPSLTHNAAPELALLILLFPLIVYSGAHVSVSSRWTPLCAFLGTISYPLYVLHPPMLWPLTLSPAIRFAHTHQPLSAPFMLAYTAGLVLLSWLAAHFYDIPVRKTLTRLYKQRSTVAIVRS
ncbi:acyltransferase family protein [Granulicella mallensis]|uniref:Acyltransferase 3 n=2 Tax=Granulicella mallensis TaxID=940614 RepID=G8P096_GRAMM|nr:acyltransferase [Granulicella mallensis]AEU36890.1 acyltransferase 3 [Granulicella mallensis MP5ACTX8]